MMTANVKTSVFMLLATLALLTPPHDAHAQQQSGQVKALFLYNFANFVRWPEQAFVNNPDELRTCIFGSADLGSFLDQVNGTRIRNKRLTVVHADKLEDLKTGCHILYVGVDKNKFLPQLFESIEHVYVLSVSHVEDFARRGGVISILRTSDKLSFEINLDTALKNGLLISSDLLTMARIVGRDGKPVKPEDVGPDDRLLNSEQGTVTQTSKDKKNQ